MILSQANTVIIIVAAVFIGVVFLTLLIVFLTFFRLWLQAFLSGRPIPLFQLIGMKIRRVPGRLIVESGIAASQAGYPIPWSELETAYLRGVDLNKVTLAFITAKRRDDPFTFEELVDAESEQRLADLIKN